ncbi:plasmid stabilization protein [Rhizobium sp. 18065]|uniref:plasmid stabilization protein n=1 Tax=Rhizobium sp. 18065 TaxID=2681411 RepID=UPI00135BF228|nr:plasmid stabilization protein [Rhizobium sp. 18065]
MAEPQLSVRSSRARDLAHRPARRENCSIADIVVRALEAYETRQTGRESAADFYRRISVEAGLDFVLSDKIREDYQPHQGPEL